MAEDVQTSQPSAVCSTLGMYINDLFDFGSQRPPISEQVSASSSSDVPPWTSRLPKGDYFQQRESPCIVEDMQALWLAMSAENMISDAFRHRLPGQKG